MREYNLSIKEALTRGLRAHSDDTLNGAFLTECKFLRPTERGLRDVVRVVDPFDPDHAPSYSDGWPFPQVFVGKEVTLVAERDLVYEVDTSGDQWTVSSAFTTYDYFSQDDTHSILEAGPWHFIDCGPTWFLLNAWSMVFKTNLEGMITGLANAVFIIDKNASEALAIQTGCYYKGRILFGGFDPAIDWETFWETYETYGDSFGFTINKALTMRDNFVWWSTIGGGDFLGLFDITNGPLGVLSEDPTAGADESQWMDLWRRNEMGMMPMPWNGTIQRMLPLGKGVIVYGASGIAGLFPVAEPFPTFGLQKILDIGIASRSAAGGDENSHVFVCTDGSCWKIGVDWQPVKLGYREFLYPMVGQEIVVSHNPKLDEFYISGENSDSDPLSYILTKTGLGESEQQVTSCIFTDGEFTDSVGEDDDTEVVIKTNAFDLGVRDLKTITTIELGIATTYDVSVALEYRNNVSDAFTMSSYVPVNSSGFARIQKTVLEFRLCIKVANSIDVEIDYCNIKWNLVGKRTIRGLSAPTADA